VALPAGTDGTLRVWYAGEPLWRVGDAVSLVTLVCLVLRALRKKKGMG
jgi:hypothetical protein